MSLSILLLACDNKTPNEMYKSKITIPLLKECKDFTNQYLQSINDNRFTYLFLDIDYILPSSPNIIGFVEIKSEVLSKQELMARANTFIIDCYPESKTTISKHKNDSGEHLMKIISLNDRMNRYSYIVNTENEIYLYINRRMKQSDSN